MAETQKITTFLWFNQEAEEAANFYVSLFKDSKILTVSRYGEGGPGPKGSAMVVEFQLAGQTYQALNGGPHFKFTEAISLMVDCESQEEVDMLWSKLTANGGQESQCGWLKDRYGLSWQIVPKRFKQMMKDGNPKQAQRVMQAMMTMKKFDISRLEQAYAQA
ncbi:VOC family protein [Archangium lansingense]|uniref:VOC family protein n=1 Tax=Archangium lansingense TaxID=2995310 RepID=A0ABT4AIV7_9BACT|nr:VOC family protein [Archangium lansinium]MCY1081124.1 VOC family protein [Archangium lansinium]